MDKVKRLAAVFSLLLPWLATIFGTALPTVADAQQCGLVSQCPFASSPLDGTELFYLIQRGQSRKITATDLGAALIGTQGFVYYVDTNAALENFPVTSAPIGTTVVRNGFYSFDGPGRAVYVLVGTGCTLNSGAGDNGTQVVSNRSANRCWWGHPDDQYGFGAKAGDPTFDSSTSMNAMITAYGSVKFAAGVFYANLVQSRSNTTSDSVGVDFQVRPFDPNLPAFKANAINFSFVKNMNVTGNGAGVGDGIQLWHTDNTVVQSSTVISIPHYGISCIGGSPPNSGSGADNSNIVLFSGLANYRWENCNDGLLADSQGGGLDSGSNTPAKNLDIVDSSATHFSRLKIYGGGLALSCSGGNFDFFEELRVSQSDVEGAKFSGCDLANVNNNQFYGNSQLNVGTKADVALISSPNTNFVGNSMFVGGFGGGASYNLTADSSSSALNATGNNFAESVIAPTNIDPAIQAFVTLCSNYPTQNAYTNFCPIQGYQTQIASASGGSGASTFLGNTVGSSVGTVSWTVAATGVISGFNVNVGTTPTGSDTYTCALYQNGGPTSITGVLNSTSTFGLFVRDPAHAIIVQPLQKIEVGCLASGSAPSQVWQASVAEYP